MTQPPARVGFLYPSHSGEDDYPCLQRLLSRSVDIELLHTEIGEDLHTEAALRDTGDVSRLKLGAAKLRDLDVQSAMWACTSGSFVFGLTGARAQAQAIEDIVRVPASSTSLAFVDALNVLNLRRVAVAATYPEDIARLFERCLTDAGIEVEYVAWLGAMTSGESANVSSEEVIRLATSTDRPNAQAVLLPDTALRTAALLDDLDTCVGKPVLTANQVTMWQALRLAKVLEPQNGLGHLFRHGS